MIAEMNIWLIDAECRYLIVRIMGKHEKAE
jgi:hypothetical protein